MNKNTSTGKGLIYSQQMTFDNKGIVIGYSNGKIQVREIAKNVADKIIKENHYSHKVYNATYINLGIYAQDNTKKLLGVLQYGSAMNPASCSSVVRDTKQDEYLELNRMWISDDAPQYTESMSIGCSIKYIRQRFPKIQWIQSFADERCKCFGIVYQACSFDYYGEHTSVFWELDGVAYHNISMTVSKDSDRYKHNVGNCIYLQQNKDRARKMVLRQFRYIKFLDKRAKERCLLTQMPYPKYYK